jgi:hypothetical protein
MELCAAPILASGDDPGWVHPSQLCLEPALGLVAVSRGYPPGPAGIAAARTALAAVRRAVEPSSDLADRLRNHATAELRDQALSALEDAIARASQEVFALARRAPGLEVVLDVVWVTGQDALLAHVGDGRVCLLREGLFHQLTADHRATMRTRGLLTGAEAPDPIARLTRSLGPQPRVEPEMMCVAVRPDDRLVVLPAGLQGGLAEPALRELLLRANLEAVSAELQRRAPGRALLGAVAQLDGVRGFDADASLRLRVIRAMTLFAHCNEAELRTIAEAARPRRIEPGATLFREGEEGAELFLVIEGQVEIYRAQRLIITLGAGATLGEMALLDEPIRSATASCPTGAELLVLSREAFYQLLRSEPTLAVKVLWNLTLSLSARLRETSGRLAKWEDAR